MKNQDLELAIITDISYGYVDNQGVGLSLAVRILRGGAVVFMDAENVTQFLNDTKISNITAFNGKPCIVRVKDNTITFVNMLDI